MFDSNKKIAGGLADSSMGQKATHTRLRSMSLPEWFKLKAEIEGWNPTEKKSENDSNFKDMLDRLDETDQAPA